MRGITGRTQLAGNLFHPMVEEGRGQVGRLPILVRQFSVAVPGATQTRGQVLKECRMRTGRGGKGREGKGNGKKDETETNWAGEVGQGKGSCRLTQLTCREPHTMKDFR
jgi:hypothetical protein